MTAKKEESQPQHKPQPKAKRGRPPKRVVKINDSPRNVARALFGIRSNVNPV